MMRKKLLNKDKFLFKEDERLPPPPVPSRVSAQSRLFKKADNRPAFNQPVGTVPGLPLTMPPLTRSVVPPSHTNQRSNTQVGGDPVLDAVVAKLKSGQFSTGNCGIRGQVGGNPGQSPCVCERPLKLILCGGCGMTFPGRLKLACVYHPHDIYLLDVEECKGCRKNRQGLVEYDLPQGMEAGMKNTRIK